MLPVQHSTIILRAQPALGRGLSPARHQICRMVNQRGPLRVLPYPTSVGWIAAQPQPLQSRPRRRSRHTSVRYFCRTICLLGKTAMRPARRRSRILRIVNRRRTSANHRITCVAPRRVGQLGSGAGFAACYRCSTHDGSRRNPKLRMVNRR